MLCIECVTFRHKIHEPFTLTGDGMGRSDILQIKRKKIERRGVERNFVFVPLNAPPGREGEKGERLLKLREGGVFVKTAG